MTQKTDLPKIGDAFEFDYTYRDERTEIVKLMVVDVTDEHVLYKMPSVSVNKIFPMTHECWQLNEDERRPVNITSSIDAILEANEKVGA